MNNAKEIISLLEINKLAGGGDGSERKGLGAHAWELVHKYNFKPICTNAGPVDGPKTSMCSYRTEATHLLAMSTLLLTIAPFLSKTKITKSKLSYVWLYTDSESVIKSVQERSSPSTKNTIKDHNDIILQLKSTINELRKKHIIIELHHVKGHQYDNNDELTPEAELNTFE